VNLSTIQPRLLHGEGLFVHDDGQIGQFNFDQEPHRALSLSLPQERERERASSWRGSSAARPPGVDLGGLIVAQDGGSLIKSHLGEHEQLMR
jgi:hypothetical protein